MLSDRSTVFSMSRHPGLNWGPTDYEAGAAPSGHVSLLSKRAEVGRNITGRFTKRPQQNASESAELALLRQASCECFDHTRKAARRSSRGPSAGVRTPSEPLRSLSEGGAP